MPKAHTVICVMEAKPGREEDLQRALTEVAALSRAENTCLNYHLHQDKNNPANFILYENWISQTEHQKQFEKSYIIDLGNKLEELLVKPYQYYFAEELA